MSETQAGALVVLTGSEGSGRRTLAQHMTDTHGFEAVSIRELVAEDVAEAVACARSVFLDPGRANVAEDYLAAFHVADPDYRSFLLRSAGVDIYTPQTPRFHIESYGKHYMRFRGEVHRWAAKLVHVLSGKTSRKVVVPDATAHEWLALRVFAKEHSLSFATVLVDRPRKGAPSSDKITAFPQSWLTMAVINIEGSPGVMCSEVDGAVLKLISN